MSWLSSITGAALGVFSGHKSAQAQASLSREQMQWQSQEAQKLAIGKKKCLLPPISARLKIYVRPA